MNFLGSDSSQWYLESGVPINEIGSEEPWQSLLNGRLFFVHMNHDKINSLSEDLGRIVEMHKAGKGPIKRTKQGDKKETKVNSLSPGEITRTCCSCVNYIQYCKCNNRNDIHERTPQRKPRLFKKFGSFKFQKRPSTWSKRLLGQYSVHKWGKNGTFWQKRTIL